MLTDDLVKNATAFHGHLGPFLIIGLRMGLLAREKLKPKEIHSLKAIVKTKLKAPYSCIIDGIQVSSLCTLGKNNISVLESDILEAVFESKTNKIKISVKDEVVNKIISLKLKRDSPEMMKFSDNVKNFKDSELFEIEIY
ncbi:MAG: formylmethanofuran dehydrogenase subunit E [Candidatus Helarchaeota archaeon]|nr:formylmethanofuran dehydrogenase subunit E [Candidatus Helarchaeota archaeon]